MNRIDRLFATLLLLQHHQVVRAEDLARRFEISKRTVYRDVTALSEMGVPIISLPGEGYGLMEGYFLPPLIFTPEEASALYLGADLLTTQASGSVREHAAATLEKIANILPSSTRRVAEELSEIIHFYVPQHAFDLDDRRLLDLRRAIRTRLPVRITYHGYRDDVVTTRIVEPHRLTYAEGVWYVDGYCRLRAGLRTFRLNRIQEYVLLAEPLRRDQRTMSRVKRP